MNADDPLICIDVRCILKETAAAFQVCDVSGQIYWMPKSQTDQSHLIHAGDRNITIAISEWIAKQKGFIA